MNFHTRIALTVCLCGAAGSCTDSTSPFANRAVEDVQLVFDDIPRFWAAFDEISSADDSAPLRDLYLNVGSQGLRDFTAARWRNAATLTAMVWPLRAYYSGIRANTLSHAAVAGPAVRDAMRGLVARHPEALLPDVYFAIGGMSTGGTTSANGLLIGVELFSDDPGAPRTALTPWHLSVIRPAGILPTIVAHELVHFQQRTRNAPTLLGKAIQEGSADFVAELLTGANVNSHLHAYGDPRELALWNAFKLEMMGTSHANWLYNGGTVTATSRPADLGYYIGYKITQAYWDTQADKARALRDIFNITNFALFLSQSGYAGGGQ